jgi:hypothetical protein
LISDEKKSLPEPKFILRSYGVRDQQLSQFSDLDMKPTPMMFRWQIARLIRKTRSGSKVVFNGKKPSMVRVSVQDYSRNLDEIATLWPDVPILYFVFPNLRMEVSKHDQVIIDRKGIYFEKQVDKKDFFVKDKIHLNQQGNQHFSRVLTPHVLELLGKTKHIE